MALILVKVLNSKEGSVDSHATATHMWEKTVSVMQREPGTSSHHWQNTIGISNSCGGRDAAVATAREQGVDTSVDTAVKAAAEGSGCAASSDSQYCSRSDRIALTLSHTAHDIHSKCQFLSLLMGRQLADRHAEALLP